MRPDPTPVVNVGRKDGSKKMSELTITVLLYSVPFVTLFVMLVALWDAGVFDRFLAPPPAEKTAAATQEIDPSRWLLRSPVRPSGLPGRSMRKG